MYSQLYKGQWKYRKIARETLFFNGYKLDQLEITRMSSSLVPAPRQPICDSRVVVVQLSHLYVVVVTELPRPPTAIILAGLVPDGVV